MRIRCVLELKMRNLIVSTLMMTLVVSLVVGCHEASEEGRAGRLTSESGKDSVTTAAAAEYSLPVRLGSSSEEVRKVLGTPNEFFSAQAIMVAGLKGMTRSVEELLDSFEKLPEAEKRELASEIIKRSLAFDMPQLSDDSLLLAADEVFLQLDKDESIHGETHGEHDDGTRDRQVSTAYCGYGERFRPSGGRLRAHRT